MRDDLHKKAPVPRRAQHVLKLALREADRLRPDRLREAAERALDQHVRNSLSATTLQVLAASESQRDLFGGAAGQSCSPSEHSLHTQLSSGTSQADGRTALENAILDEANSWIREMRATLVANGGARDVAVIVGAVSDAFRAATPNVAVHFCGGETLASDSSSLSLNENLLPPGRGRASK